MASQPGVLLAFIDESGQRSRSVNASDHFVMSAVVVRGESLPKVSEFLTRLRVDLDRRTGDHLTFKNIKHHGQRLHIAQSIGSQQWLWLCSVVVCKRHIGTGILNDDQAYLYTARYLFERLSWLGRSYQSPVSCTFAAIQRFPIAKLREYEAILQDRPTRIDWRFLDPKGGQMNQPQRYEPLQMGDLVASATAQAFEPDRFKNVEPRYLQAMAPRIWGGPYAQRRITSYGLKMHPWNDATRAAYPWVTAL